MTNELANEVLGWALLGGACVIIVAVAAALAARAWRMLR